jgi:hypothetical protein
VWPAARQPPAGSEELAESGAPAASPGRGPELPGALALPGVPVQMPAESSPWLVESCRRLAAVLPVPARSSRGTGWPAGCSAASAVWEPWAEPFLRAEPDVPESPPAAENGARAAHAGALPRVARAEPVVPPLVGRAGSPARRLGVRAAEVAPRPAERCGGAVRRQAVPRGAPAPRAGVVPPLVARAGRARHAVAAAWAFRRDRFRLVRRRAVLLLRAEQSW